MMADARHYPLLPYSYIVGQDALCRMLEVAYVMPSVGGVLVSGERGTAKSTIVRAFARMMYGELPVTLPINATDDRVMGGWRIDALMRGKPELLTPDQQHAWLSQVAGRPITTSTELTRAEISAAINLLKIT